MARRVFWHIGLPKTGTTYLQDILWSNADALRASGLTLPGRGHREHLWAALEVQEQRMHRRDPRAKGAWERLLGEVERADGDVLLTHEFFCGASKEQAARAAERLAPAEVHVIVTARHSAAMLTAGWQELVKNGGQADIDEVAGRRSRSEFSWRTWDLHGVLQRWEGIVPPERLHVLPMPGRDEPADQHWRNLREVLGVTDDFTIPDVAANRSLGAAQVELLRRVNRHLDDFRSTSAERGYWIRGYLAERHLVAQEGERFGLPDDLVADCRNRSDRAVDLIKDRGFHVVGDVESLRVPSVLPTQRNVDDVTEAEMLESATELIAAMLSDLRTMQEGDKGPGSDDGGRLSLGNKARKAMGRAGRAVRPRSV